MTTPEENKELVERGSFDVYEEGELELVDELVSDDYELHDPSWPEEIRGRDGFKQSIETIRNALPDLSISIEHMTAEDDLVTVHFTFRGTHEGPIPELGLEATGEEVEVVGMEVDRIEDGKLAETWVVNDTLGFMQQLGVIPAEEPSLEA
jgi:steroid delta-isomerase-like uncharacterized protein